MVFGSVLIFLVFLIVLFRISRLLKIGVIVVFNEFSVWVRVSWFDVVCFGFSSVMYGLVVICSIVMLVVSMNSVLRKVLYMCSLVVG